jgi:hypothetical protein
VQLYRYFKSHSNEFCRHNPLCYFSTSVYYYCFVVDFVIYSVRKLLGYAVVIANASARFVRNIFHCVNNLTLLWLYKTLRLYFKSKLAFAMPFTGATKRVAAEIFHREFSSSPHFLLFSFINLSATNLTHIPGSKIKAQVKVKFFLCLRKYHAVKTYPLRN